MGRKEKLSPTVDFAAFKSWLEEQATGTTQQTSAGSLKSTGADEGAEPAYPSSFAHIVELITTGQPIPGIQEIPDTVLTGHDLASEKPRRRKPWEKEDLTDHPVETTSAVP